MACYIKGQIMHSSVFISRRPATSTKLQYCY